MSHPDVPEQSSRYTVPRNDAQVRPGTYHAEPAIREAVEMADEIVGRIYLHDQWHHSGAMRTAQGQELRATQVLDLERLESIFEPSPENAWAIKKLREQLGKPAVQREPEANPLERHTDEELAAELMDRGWGVIPPTISPENATEEQEQTS